MARPRKPLEERRVRVTAYLLPALLARIRAAAGATPISAWMEDACRKALREVEREAR